MRYRATSPNGFSLLEVLIAMTILLVGLLGLLHLQIYGITANQGARAQDQANFLARQLAGALEQYGNASSTNFSSSYLTATATCSSSDTSADSSGLIACNTSTSFGSLLSSSSAAQEWCDTYTSTFPSVTLNTALETDTDGTQIYKRRWTVMDYYDSAGSTSAIVKIIAVSVIYHERALTLPREVIVYAQVVNPANLFSNVTNLN